LSKSEPLSKSIDVDYVEQFIHDFRAGYKEFAKPESQEDKKWLDELYAAMEKYDLAKQKHLDAQARPPLTLDTANQLVPIQLAGREAMDKIRELVMTDRMERNGLFRDVEAFNFKLMLDRARFRGLVHDSECVSTKFKDCMEKNTDLMRQLDDARRKIIRLETMLRLHGLNPDEASSYSSNVEGGHDSHV
jgi:hypothetical protein